jgi:hypothetical protein
LGKIKEKVKIRKADLLLCTFFQVCSYEISYKMLLFSCFVRLLNTEVRSIFRKKNNKSAKRKGDKGEKER